jgi:hypothetical protein
MSSKVVSRGVKHPDTRFIGTRLDEDTFAKFQSLALSVGETPASALRRIVTQKVLASGVKHLAR